MRVLSAVTLLASLAITGGCAAPPARDAATRATVPPRIDAERPPSLALEREVRYYLDEEGMVWDDRGRKLGPPSTATPKS